MNYSDEIINIDIVSESSLGNYTHSDVKLFLCLQGETVVTCQEAKSRLRKEEMVIVNPRDKHSYNVKKDSLVAVFYISSEYIEKITSYPGLRFRCDSSHPPEYDYEQLRDLLKKILSVHIYQRWQERIKEIQYLNSLISILLKKYAVWDFQSEMGEETDRMETIIQFIHHNYNRQIGLQDLTDKLHLTVPYLSKYIKQNLKTGFVEYLNEIRLSHTIDDLNSTNYSMTRIAFDNGFSSLTSFNRVFKDAFSVTPTEYRKEHGIYKNEDTRKKEEIKIDLLKGYLKDNLISSLEVEHDNQIQCSIDANSKDTYQKNWERVWNLGSAEELLRADIQDHVLLLKKELNIKTVRIWGLFTEDMLIHLDQDKKFNFSRINQVFDFLIENRMIPFIDMGFHPKELYSREKRILYEEKKSGYENQRNYQLLITEFVKQSVKRYGDEIAEKWIFELSKDDRFFLHGEEPFFRLFETISQCIKSYLPKAKIGGGAIYVYDNLEIFESFVVGWMKREYRPDFISVWIYPYDIIKDGKTIKEMKMSSNPDYVCDKLNAINQKMLQYHAKNIPIYISRWDMSLYCRDFLNESCYRGAYILKNTIASIGEAEVMSCFGSTDLFCEYYDSVAPLNGSYGLITRNGIKKPAFFAYYFLNKMGKYMHAKGENYFITSDDHGTYYILVFNCCRMEMQYYCEQKLNISVEEVQNLFDNEKLEIQILINKIENGEYIVKFSSMKPGEGSILDEWKKLDYKSNLEKGELQYLKDICIPRMRYETTVAKKDVLKLSVLLEANEIQLIEIQKDIDKE